MSSRIIIGIGRICISIIFILIGVSAIFQWDVARLELSNALSNWKLYVGQTDVLAEFIETLITVIPLLIILGISLQVLGGALLFFGIYVRLAAFLLVVYVICMTVTYQYFWFLKGGAMSRSLVLFLKNLAILGGLLGYLGYGGKNSSSKEEIISDD